MDRAGQKSSKDLHLVQRESSSEEVEISDFSAQRSAHSFAACHSTRARCRAIDFAPCEPSFAGSALLVGGRAGGAGVFHPARRAAGLVSRQAGVGREGQDRAGTHQLHQMRASAAAAAEA
eukprot:3250829-Prymnesium_polylepis.1